MTTHRSDNNKNPAVQTARERADGDRRVITLQTGDQARLVPVSAALIDEVSNRVKDPPVPMVYVAEKEREEENPSDPAYLRAMGEAARLRGIAVMDAMVMFGVELLDGVPEDDGWIKKLQFMERRGQIDLSSFDLTDPLDREFCYKRYVAVPTTVIEDITRISGVSAEDIERAERSFPGN